MIFLKKGDDYHNIQISYYLGDGDGRGCKGEKYKLGKYSIS